MHASHMRWRSVSLMFWRIACPVLHFAHATFPQSLQWCFRVSCVNFWPQKAHSLHSPSCTQRGAVTLASFCSTFCLEASICLFIWSTHSPRSCSVEATRTNDFASVFTRSCSGFFKTSSHEHPFRLYSFGNNYWESSTVQYMSESLNRYT